HSMNTAFMLAGVDMNKWLAFRKGEPEKFAEFTQLGRKELGFFQTPYVSWRNNIALFLGPRQSGLSALDIDDMTEVEIRSQLGVRHTRRLAGVGRVERNQWAGGMPFADEIGVSPSVSPKFPVISVPYGALVPVKLDGLLACGRHMSCDANSH